MQVVHYGAVLSHHLWFKPLFLTMKSAYQSSSRRDVPFNFGGFTSLAVMPDMKTKMKKKKK